jgi:hypothetical protein
MSFYRYVGRPRVVGAIATAVAFLALVGLTWGALTFIVFTDGSRSGDARTAATFYLLLLLAFLGGIACRSIWADNIDTVIETIGPLGRRMLRAALEEQDKADTKGRPAA